MWYNRLKNFSPLKGGENREVFMAWRTRVFCLVLALCLGAFSLSSCAKESVLRYGEESLSEDLFCYALTLTKTKMLATLSGSSTNLQDSPEIWTTELEDGSTYADLVVENTLKTVQMTLFYAAFAKENGVMLTDSEKEAASASVQQIVSSFESRADFDRYMAAYGFDYELLCRYYELDALSQAGMRAYYAHPLTSLTEADVKDYYEAHYVTGIFLYVNETDTLLSNGKRVPLSAEEKEKRSSFFDGAAREIEKGAPFSDFLEESDNNAFEDGAAKTMLLSAVTPEVLKGALGEMEEGVLRTVKSEKGRYLVKKEALSEEFYEENAEALLLSLVSERETEILESSASSFWKNEAYFTSLDVANLAIF